MKTTRNNKVGGLSKGSALILVLVLVSLLAIVGTMFMLVSRVNNIATSAVKEDRDLKFAVDSITEAISQRLTSDISYYDYPDVNNPWLAANEPNSTNGIVYRWRQISDISGGIYFASRGIAYQQVLVDPPGVRKTMVDHSAIALDSDGQLALGNNDDGISNLYRGQLADADGDGVADSKWMPAGKTTKGEQVYAAIRIIDNGGMLNVNTAHRFDPLANDANQIDGSSQRQINIIGVRDPCEGTEQLRVARCGTNDPNSWLAYERDVVWNFDANTGTFLPFDMSDELGLRYRYCIRPQAVTRLDKVWNYTIGSLNYVGLPYDGHTNSVPHRQLDDWQLRTTWQAALVSDRRHVLTTYNIDRISDPNGKKMLNINSPNADPNMYNKLLASIDPCIPVLAGDINNLKSQYAQFAVNLKDFRDTDTQVTMLTDAPGKKHYGFEAQPYITEVAWLINPNPQTGSNFFAVELFNPSVVTINLADFSLELHNRVFDPCIPDRTVKLPAVNLNAGGYFVVSNSLASFGPIVNGITDPNLALFSKWQTDRSKPISIGGPSWNPAQPPANPSFASNYDLYLKRVVDSNTIYVDRQMLNKNYIGSGIKGDWSRDVRDWHVVYQVDTNAIPPTQNLSLGLPPNPVVTFANQNWSFFMPNSGRRIITVGDIPRILTIGPDTTRDNTVGAQLARTINESLIRLNLQNPHFRNLFQYLTVMDPNEHLRPLGETRIKGRININTAPWYVISQLPWVTPQLAKAIVAYRDKQQIPSTTIDYRNRFTAVGFIVGAAIGTIRETPGFASIGELNFVTAGASDANFYDYSIDRYSLYSKFYNKDVNSFPDLTRDCNTCGDGIIGDYEERDLVFARISNLVTVRSDVFTAYILVRIGTDGPQKRAIAILDRSQAAVNGGRVKIVALQYVPDAR